MEEAFPPTPAPPPPADDDDAQAPTPVTVCVRLRPAGGADGDLAWRAAEDELVQLAGKGAGERYRFDHVCDADAHTTEVYDHACRSIVGDLVCGRSGTLLAYGQTASGKTHTMQGFMRLACEQIFEAEGETTVSCVYLEVYNEAVRDLLNPESAVALREEKHRGVYVSGAHRVVIRDPNELDALLKRGEKRRRIGKTRMNSRSSRSHAVLQLHVATDVRGVVFSATLSLVDLAGSEKPRRSRAEHPSRSQRANFAEGVMINKSLTTLSHVLKQLGDGERAPSFRNSKLTRLLQPTLSGGAKLALVCCVAPGTACLEETRTTLQFGQRANRVALRAPRPRPRPRDDDQLRALAARLERENVQLARAVAAKSAALAEERARVAALEAAAAAANAASPPSARTRRARRRRSRRTWAPGDAPEGDDAPAFAASASSDADEAAAAAEALARDAATFRARVDAVVGGARDAVAESVAASALDAAVREISAEADGAIAAARADSAARRASCADAKEAAANLKRRVKELQATVENQRLWIRENDEADDLKLEMRKLRKTLDAQKAQLAAARKHEAEAADLRARLDDARRELAARAAEAAAPPAPEAPPARPAPSPSPPSPPWQLSPPALEEAPTPPSPEAAAPSPEAPPSPPPPEEAEEAPASPEAPPSPAPPPPPSPPRQLSSPAPARSPPRSSPPPSARQLSARKPPRSPASPPPGLGFDGQLKWVAGFYAAGTVWRRLGRRLALWRVVKAALEARAAAPAPPAPPAALPDAFEEAGASDDDDASLDGGAREAPNRFVEFVTKTCPRPGNRTPEGSAAFEAPPAAARELDDDMRRNRARFRDFVASFSPAAPGRAPLSPRAPYEQVATASPPPAAASKKKKRRSRKKKGGGENARPTKSLVQRMVDGDDDL